NLFSDSLVCLKAETGERVWHFQLVHHDLWDYDLPAAPILADIRVNGKPIKAVVQVTKQGFAFVFDRGTGQTVWLIKARSVTGTFAADLVSGNTVQSNLRYVHGTREFVTGPRGLPLFKPPYGRITAINLNTGDHVWVKPNGDGPREHPAIKHLNLPPLGQP